ncbi:MAG: sulfotransferase [Phycisphaerales bacterium]|jgi:hypothetical protein
MTDQQATKAYSLTPTERAKKLLRHANMRRRSLVLQWRQTQAGRRRLPDFIVIGAQKSGSTSMYHYLREHPQVVGSYEKEVQYFDGGLAPEPDRYARGEAWYRAQFPLASRVPAETKVFEATPRYLHHPLVPGRIAKDLPGVRLIAVLRDPVQRAISHYFHTYGQGREPLPIWEAFEQEASRLAPIIERQDYRDPAYDRHAYVMRGRYREQLDRYLEHFPREQIMVLQAEHLYANLPSELPRIFEFLGIDPSIEISNLKPRNMSKRRKDVPEKVYEYLTEYYKPHNEALRELLGDRFTWDAPAEAR